MKYDLSILFYIKRAKEDKKGLIPIYLRITINGERSELSANRKIELTKWDRNSQRAKGRSEESKAINNLDKTHKLTTYRQSKLTTFRRTF